MFKHYTIRILKFSNKTKHMEAQVLNINTIWRPAEWSWLAARISSPVAVSDPNEVTDSRLFPTLCAFINHVYFEMQI